MHPRAYHRFAKGCGSNAIKGAGCMLAILLGKAFRVYYSQPSSDSCVKLSKFTRAETCWHRRHSWSTQFPLATSTWPNTAEALARASMGSTRTTSKTYSGRMRRSYARSRLRDSKERIKRRRN